MYGAESEYWIIPKAVAQEVCVEQHSWSPDVHYGILLVDNIDRALTYTAALGVFLLVNL